MEAIGCFMGSEEGVKGLADDWTEAVGSTCCALGLVAVLSRDESW